MSTTTGSAECSTTSTRSTRITAPSDTLPASSMRPIRVSTSRAMYRRSGRAPYTGSKPCRAMNPLRRLGHLQGHPPVGEPGTQVVEHQVHDPLDLGLGERLEQHDLVHPVEELG